MGHRFVAARQTMGDHGLSCGKVEKAPIVGHIQAASLVDRPTWPAEDVAVPKRPPRPLRPV